jgi:hypothetical protein
MGQRYEQLSLEEHCTLSRFKQAGKTVRQILVDFSAALSHYLTAALRVTTSAVAAARSLSNDKSKVTTVSFATNASSPKK